METRLEDFGGRGIGCNVAPELAIGLVRPDDHGKSVPTHDRRETLLDRNIARVHRLLIERQRILISRVRHHVRDDAQLLRLLLKLGEQIQPAFTATRCDCGA